MAVDFGAIANAAGQTLDAISRFWSTNKTNNANREINASQIQAAKDMLKSEQDYSTYMMQNQKQFQMQDLKNAGVNPAFAQGSQLGANAASSPTQSVPNQIPMMPYDLNIGSGVANSIQYMLQKKMVEAQTQNLYADTYKKMAETDRQRIENKYLPSLLRGQCDMIESNIAVNASIKFKNEWEAKNFAQNILESNKRIEQIGAQIQELQQRVQVMKVDERIKLIEEYWKSDECKATINNLMASADLSRANAHYLMATEASQVMLLDSLATTEMYKALNIDANTQNARDTNRLIHIEGDHMEFNLKSDKKYRNKERALGIVKGATEAVHNITSSIGDLVGTLNPVTNAAKFVSTSTK